MNSTRTIRDSAAFWRKRTPWLCAIALLYSGTAFGQKKDDPTPDKHRPAKFSIAPIKSRPYGKSYGQWGAAWWTWALSFPSDRSPIQDTTGELGSQGQSGPVWFLAGTGGGAVERTITIPTGKGVFFPLLNVINDYPCPDPNFQPGPGQTLEEFLTEGAAFFVDHATELSLEVDGVPVKNPFNYRAASGLFTFTGDPSLTSFDPCITGEPQPAVTDGYWIMLRPLTPGKHTIHFVSKAEFPEFGFEFTVEVTYHLKVVRAARIAPPHSEAYGKTLSEWLGIYWRWIFSGANPDEDTVGRVQLMPIPAGELVSGTGTPADPAYLRGQLEITLPPGTPFVLPAFAWIGERYDGYPAEPDDIPVADDVLLSSVQPNMTINGLPVLTDANEEAHYVSTTPFDPIVVYPAPSSYGSVAALFYQSCGIVARPLPPGKHVIHLYEPYIIAAGAYPPLPDGFGVIYDNTWIVTVSPH
jgi:hypothetical protein